MNIQFTQSDLPSLMIKVLFENHKWYDKTNLYKETRKYYETNPECFNTIHFAFDWEVLLSNSNFISVTSHNNIQYINGIFSSVVCKNKTDIDIPFVEPDNTIDFKLDESETITHICSNKKIYYRSNVLDTFFTTNFPQYQSVYELLIVNRQKIPMENIMEFINLYSGILKTDDIINLIIIKKYNGIISNNTNNTQIITKPNNFLYNLVCGIGFVGISSLFAYRNTWALKYFNWFQK